jgi:serine/threonine protein phosphatase PrpC
VELAEGDLLVLCSDGLHGMLDDRAIAEAALRHDDLDRAAELLVSLANAAGGKDNVSVVLVRAVNESVEVEVCCAACGKRVIEGNAFCIECGQPIA